MLHNLFLIFSEKSTTTHASQKKKKKKLFIFMSLESATAIANSVLTVEMKALC